MFLARIALAFLVAVPCLCLEALGQDYAQAVRPAEFHGVAFGANQADVPDLVPAPGLRDTFHRKNEDLTLGQAKLLSVAYYFSKGRMTGVGVVIQGDGEIFRAQEYLFGKYGTGRQRGASFGWTWPDFSLTLTRLQNGQAALRYTLEKMD